MTLEEAKAVAEGVIGETVYTPETLVSSAFNAVCLEKGKHEYEVWGDGFLLGEGSTPESAWLDAAGSLPEEFVQAFRYFPETQSFKRAKGGPEGSETTLLDGTEVGINTP